ncbi:hypothetical protein JW826_02040 [Candidatus Woesearchaeota archaeon]|nr:hypothetical protein [Candidatus Woesearchaeota archaeon]
MWLIITLIATILASTACLLLKGQRKKYKLGLLALMLLGTFLMVLVDHLIAFMEGEPLIELATDGLIASGTMLGIAMIIPIIAIWIVAILVPAKTKHKA